MNQVARLDDASREIAAPSQQESIGLNSFAEVCAFADRASKTNLVPVAFKGKPDDIVVCIMQGMELGLNPMQSLNAIAVVNGRPSLFGDAQLALVYRSGKLEDMQETDDGDTATCTVIRKGRSPVSRGFSMDDAKRAGLAGKSGPWQQYPKRMRQMRARAFALRDAFPDVLQGIALYEEAQDMPVMRDVTPHDEAVTEDQPKAAKLRGKIGKAKPQQDEASTAPTLEEVVAAIDAATDEAKLAEAGSKAAQLATEDERSSARAAYRGKLARLRDAAAKSQENETGLSLEEGDDDPSGLTPDQQAELDRAEAEFRQQQDATTEA